MRKFFLAVMILCCHSFEISAQLQQKLTNVILIVADDLGFSDLSVYGSSFYETPHLDKLAAKGIRFTQSYATSPVCSPTRASLLTGKYPVKTGVTDWIKGRHEDGKAKPFEKMVAQPTAYQLALEETTIAEYALANGYQTFFAGKWHLGEEEKFWPENQGFQTNIAGWSKGSPTGRINDSTGGFFTPYNNPRITDGPKGEYLSNRLTDECIAFLNQPTQQPFFMMYSLYAVHNPMQAPDSLIKKYQAKQKKLGVTPHQRFAKDEEWMKYDNGWKRRMVQDHAVYAAMVENMDWNVGRIMTELEKLGLDENTLVIFTSDNGGLSTAEGSVTSNSPLRAGKGWMYEGGIRVPTIFYWKNKLVEGSISNLPITAADFYPSIAKLMNNKYRKEKNIDGGNIFDLLKQDNKKRSRRLFWYYPHYSNQGGTPSACIREGKYKLIYFYDNKNVELYNIDEDLSEKNNIASLNPKIARSLHKKLLQWLKKNNASEPTPNKNYNPNFTVSSK